MDELGRLVAFIVGSLIIGGVATLICHPTHRAASEGIIGFVLICTVISSVISFARGVSISIPEYGYGDYGEGAVVDAAREALTEGIRTDLCSRFSLDGEEVAVELFDFSFPELRAMRVRVELTGGGILADYRAMRDYVCDNYTLEGGKCEVIFVE